MDMVLKPEAIELEDRVVWKLGVSVLKYSRGY